MTSFLPQWAEKLLRCRTCHYSSVFNLASVTNIANDSPALFPLFSLRMQTVYLFMWHWVTIRTSYKHFRLYDYLKRLLRRDVPVRKDISPERQDRRPLPACSRNVYLSFYIPRRTSIWTPPNFGEKKQQTGQLEAWRASQRSWRCDSRYHHWICGWIDCPFCPNCWSILVCPSIPLFPLFQC